MPQITPQIHQFTKMNIEQIYVIKEQNQVTLIDTGMKGHLKWIEKKLLTIGITVEEIDHLIITHDHVDHIGNIAPICERANPTVFIHPLDFASIEDQVGDCVIHELRHGEKLGILDGLEVIHIAGHSPGSIALYDSTARVLIAGDNLFNFRKLSFPPKKFCSNYTEYLESIRQLLYFDIQIICPGHGRAIMKDGNTAIKALIDG